VSGAERTRAAGRRNEAEEHTKAALRTRLAPAVAALRAAQQQAAALTRGPADAFDLACLDAHEAGYSLAAIGRAIGEPPEMVRRRVDLARVVRDRDVAKPPVPLPTVGMVRLSPGGLVHRRWRGADDTYTARTLCGRTVTTRAAPAEATATHHWCSGCRPEPARITAVVTRPMPRVLAALLASRSPEAEAAEAERRFEAARRAPQEDDR
jgi:hypothetical protein